MKGSLLLIFKGDAEAALYSGKDKVGQDVSG